MRFYGANPAEHARPQRRFRPQGPAQGGTFAYNYNTPEGISAPEFIREGAMGAKKSTPEGAVLLAESGPLQGERWMVRGRLLIGRAPDCTIVIPDRQVSRHHAAVWLDDQGAWLEDLGSKNGTFLNGERVLVPTPLHDGDEIQIALAQKLIFLSSEATLPLEEAPSAPPGRLRLDAAARRVWIAGQEVLPPLSVAQFRLLEVLYHRAGEVVPREDIIRAVWGEEAVGVSAQALDALVRRLRDRLAEFDPGHQYIVSVRGHGLRLDNPPR